MAIVEFAQYSYFPCLQCSEPEQIAYSNLSAVDKDSILPIFELSQVKYEAHFSDSVSAIKGLVGNRPFILDLSKDRAPPAYVPKSDPDQAKIAKINAAQNNYNSAMTGLLNPQDGFSAWRDLARSFSNAIPVIQFTDPETQANSILRQASRLSNGGAECLALRISAETNEAIFATIGQILSILDDASRLLVILDCGQGRLRVSERAEFAKLATSRILEEIEPAHASSFMPVCVSDFYTTPPGHNGVQLYENHAWQLWAEATETFPMLFGDYCGNYRFKKRDTFMPGDWRAQVNYPLDEAWIVYRHENSQDVTGWPAGAAEIAEHGAFGGYPQCWGGQLLKNAASGDIDGVASARFWHAAKINMHIHRQIPFAFSKMAGGGSD